MNFGQVFLNRQGQQKQETLESIRYQLTVLLNSEAPMVTIPTHYTETLLSNFCFGLDNLHTISSQIDHQLFARSIERLVMKFESRLSSVSVLVKESDGVSNLLVFSLMANVIVDGQEHTFLFDSNISLSNHLAKIEGQEIV
ncbi:type VI secretion system baseplate subunit TssE [Vibrio sp. SS-MA-C1-2]|uniref:type VI secretion system baseplate subunit TssE n=1 Tax=Vibrio sp. SS-MA-C1-2 TaxID=2908646 RepID=UPI001F35B0B9|nr:type VI secretion system baseplate subunit TssE [Vibrio sp. SS-MA-C1-2]UJF17204.1 type VI secretion system baseplate subunit TssE [Vibrio sp. SS-MA-C1-2]